MLKKSKKIIVTIAAFMTLSGLLTISPLEIHGNEQESLITSVWDQELRSTTQRSMGIQPRMQWQFSSWEVRIQHQINLFTSASATNLHDAVFSGTRFYVLSSIPVAPFGRVQIRITSTHSSQTHLTNRVFWAYSNAIAQQLRR